MLYLYTRNIVRILIDNLIDNLKLVDSLSKTSWGALGMPSLAIIGAQWGDEGKGKITDFIDKDADMIVRFQGGNNAGHTVTVNDKVFKLHALPSGVVRAGKISVIGNGTVVNIKELNNEINQVISAGGSVDNLRISDRAHIVMNYHKKFDS